MSYNIPVHMVDTYSTNVKLLLQAKGGKLADCVTIGRHTGELASPVDQIGAVKAQKRTTRHGDTPLISTPGDRRWAEPTDWEWADLIDQQDRLRLLIDPQSGYTLNGVMAMRRAQDDVVLGAFYATAKTGRRGTVSTAFPTSTNVIGPTVGATANTGLNIAKLRAARKKMMAYHVDFDTEELYVLLTSEEHDDLLAETQVINMDYNDRPVLKDGKIDYFLGFRIKTMEFRSTDFYDSGDLMGSGTVNYVPAWVRTGMHLGIWSDVMTRVDERPDKSYATQVYVKGTYGATRTEENKVIRIDCDSAA